MVSKLLVVSAWHGVPLVDELVTATAPAMLEEPGVGLGMAADAPGHVVAAVYEPGLLVAGAAPFGATGRPVRVGGRGMSRLLAGVLRAVVGQVVVVAAAEA